MPPAPVPPEPVRPPPPFAPPAEPWAPPLVWMQIDSRGAQAPPMHTPQSQSLSEVQALVAQ